MTYANFGGGFLGNIEKMRKKRKKEKEAKRIKKEIKRDNGFIYFFQNLKKKKRRNIKNIYNFQFPKAEGKADVPPLFYIKNLF